MRERAKVMLRISCLIDRLPPDDQRAVAYDVYRTYAPDTDIAKHSYARHLNLLKDFELRALVKTRDSDRCRYCGVTVSWADRRGSTGATYDHINPTGPNEPGNIVVSCRHCNTSKGHRTPEEAGMVLRPEPTPELSLELTPGSQNGCSSALVVAASGSVSVRSSNEVSKHQEAVDKAKAALKAQDFEFLLACPVLYQQPWLDADWWLSLRDGYPRVDLLEQASRYMAWESGLPKSRRKRDHRAALRNWIAKAERWREADEMRKAVRR